MTPDASKTAGLRARRIDLEIVIAAPADHVWRLLAEHERMPEWMPVREVVRRRAGHPDPNGVGAVRTVRTLGLAFDEEILVFEPSRRLEYTLREGAPLRDHRGVVTLGADPLGTRLRWSVRFRPRLPGTGAWLAWALRRGLRQGLDGLRLLAETGAPPRRRGRIRDPNAPPRRSDREPARGS